jgi:hypothetical protein
MDKLTDKSQLQAWAIKHGNYTLAPVHQELMNWMTKQFSVRALDFFCEVKNTSKGTPQQRVHVILETVEEVKQMQAHHADNAIIAEQFLKYFKSAHLTGTIADPLKSTDLSFLTNPFPKIIITYRPLKNLTGKTRQEMLDDDQRAILKTFESVWTMSQAVVFYYTDAQVKENLINGTSARIIEALGQVAEKYGFEPGTSYNYGFNRGSSYRFDSKESFDRDYESNWYYYWK